MHQEARAQFNASFSETKYQQMMHSIHTDYPGKLDFRIAESPVFIPKNLTKKLLNACSSIIDIITNELFLNKTSNAIPLDQKTYGENNHSSFLSIDFAICKDKDGQLTPQLIELQGFPSLLAYQGYLSELYSKHFAIHSSFTGYPACRDIAEYNQIVKKMLLATYNPEEVILLEVSPEQQKTRIDFTITEQITGVKTVCVNEVFKKNNQLFYLNDARETRIKRIYNRLILDDLQNFPALKPTFNFNDPLDVTWVGHPNWFFRISKFMLPFLKSPFVPETRFVTDYKGIYPKDLENYVLKPLFSFAGSGVQLHINDQMLKELPDPENYILQRKVTYEPLIQSPEGGVKAEIRMLYIWPDEAERPIFLNSLSRLSRGEMIGVNHNKDFTWVGSSACFFEK